MLSVPYIIRHICPELSSSRVVNLLCSVLSLMHLHKVTLSASVNEFCCPANCFS